MTERYKSKEENRNYNKMGSKGSLAWAAKVRESNEIRAKLAELGEQVDSVLKEKDYFSAIELIDRSGFLEKKGNEFYTALGRLVSVYHTAKSDFKNKNEPGEYSLETLQVRKNNLADKYQGINLNDLLN